MIKRGSAGGGGSGSAAAACEVPVGIKPVFISPDTIRFESRVRLEDLVRIFLTRAPLALRTSVSATHAPSTRRTRVVTNTLAFNLLACFA
jgi:hypothetical protein